jgi:hypothetical protein
MNIDLIKKYKKEFDHHINDGKVLHCYNSDFLWCSSGLGIWETNSLNVTHVIINDEYVEFRKALAEGKTVQFSSDISTEHWVNLELPVFNKDYRYRTKPDEPKCKVGDWVRTFKQYNAEYNNSAFAKNDIYKLTESNIWLFEEADKRRFSYEDSTPYFELWKPQPGEWYWDKDHKKLLKCSTHNDCVFKSKNQHGKGFYSILKHCEPFIGELPTYLKD